MKIFVNIPEGFRDGSFVTPKVKAHLESIGEVFYTTEQLAGEDLKNALDGYDVVITGWGQKRIMADDLKTVKLIVHTGGTIGGIVDMSVFDTDVTVLSGNGYYADSVAEGVISYMLYGLRNLGINEANLRKGIWDWNCRTEGLIDQSVGLISYGAISSRVIPILQCFTKNIKVYSTHEDEALARKMGFTYASLDEIFSTCKVVSVHTAKNDDTYHMINRHHFDLLQDGALFLNTSRGPVIDEEALIEALKEKRFKAILDVYNKEPLGLDSPLLEFENLIVFPHIAGPTYDRREGITNDLATDIERFATGETPLNIVTKEVAHKMTVA